MLLQADAYKIPLPDQSVHTVITSPPYWGLRKYSGEQQRGEFANLGLEKTPEEHIERMVSIFQEIKRVLRDDGVVWLNYGDCYAGGGRGPSESLNKGNLESHYAGPSTARIPQGNLMLMPHRVAIALQDDWIVRNDLIWFKRNPMPESVAGWRYEKDTLKKGSWRHTRAHEYIFQLVKKPKYYCNQEAVREGHSESSLKFNPRLKHHDKTSPYLSHTKDMEEGHYYEGLYLNPSGRNPRSVLDVPTAPYKGAHYATFPPNLIAPLIRASCPRRSCPECGQAWAPVVEQSAEYKNLLKRPNRLRFPFDEFANYIKKKREILGLSRADVSELIVGTRSGACWWWEIGGRPPNGKNYIALKNKLNLDDRFDFYLLSQDGGWISDDGDGLEIGKSKRGQVVSGGALITDYRPTCTCCQICDHYNKLHGDSGCKRYDPIPGIVLDPFIGSGTTGAVARELQRRWIGLDISMDYIDQQAKVRALKWTPSNALDQLPLFQKETADD